MSIDTEMNVKRHEYGRYYGRYIRLSNHSPLKDQLVQNGEEHKELLAGLDDEKALYRYQSQKWTLKQVIGHIIDTERIFQYRALAIARDEKRALPGYDHNQYVDRAGFNQMTIEDLLEQYDHTRNATISLFSGFSKEQLMKRGVVNGTMFTVRALGYVIAGHESHHLDTIRNRYMSGII